MSLDVIVGKPNPPVENVGLRPGPEQVPQAGEMEHSSMRDTDLEMMLQKIRRRSRRLAVSGGTVGSGRVVTEQSLLTQGGE